ncbi:hypothetical protein ACIRP2_37200 [Streptomyces sp. NPDC101194]|uniref:hypothetical protein n=1 Tax=Streptomyces sp. NPDC101194 TaxID=3366127 RepID=UPI0037F323CC
MLLPAGPFECWTVTPVAIRRCSPRRWRTCAGGGAVLLPGLLAVVVRRGIDVMWMAQPPIQVSPAGNGELNIAVAGADDDEVTAFSADDTRTLLGRIQAQYGTR